MYKLNILGIEANIGSMLYPFKKAGHNILGLYDSRGIITKENLEINFPGSSLFADINQPMGTKIDVIVSQPACGQHSSLNNGKNIEIDSTSEEMYLDKCIELDPDWIIIENKLGYLENFDYYKLTDRGYNVHLEWISNYYYGNTQKPRDRLYIIATKNLTWNLIPNEKTHNNTVDSVLEGLGDEDNEELDHIHRFKPILKSYNPDKFWYITDILTLFKPGQMFTYTKRDGTKTSRPGKKLTGPIYSHTITGGDGLHHWRTGYQLTHRERLRIQGFDDNFSLKGLKYNKKSAAIGKSMPQEFLTYLVSQIDGTYEGKPTGYRLRKEAKKLNEFKRELV